MNSKALSRPNDSPSSTKDDVNDDPNSSSSSSSNHNHEVDNNNNWGDEALAGEVGVFGSPSPDEALASPTSLVASFTGSAAARTRELKKLNMNVIIQRIDANEEEKKNENKNNNESNWVNEDEVMQETE